MSFAYLQDYAYDEAQERTQAHGSNRGAPPLQLHVPEYLRYDIPPALATGGGVEALHPGSVVSAQWFANSGFGVRQPCDTVAEEAYSSLEVLQQHFPATISINKTGPVAAVPSPIARPSAPDPPSPLATAPAAPAGLPLYSQSGFDAISLLARVQARVAPQIHLGPIDFTTSFVVADVRRHDAPIVYCSPSFCVLTGYAEREVLGRNCRFLQAPPGARAVEKGASRGAAVAQLAKAVAAHKEAQVSVVNFKRDGAAFVNLVSVVPLFGERGDEGPGAECVWFVGFQVDLTVQSEGIVARVREGRYYRAPPPPPPADAKAIELPPVTTTTQVVQPRERRSTAVPAPRVSATLAKLLKTPAFLASFGVLPPATTIAPAGGLPPDPSSHALHALLLSALPDFVHVLSLKGAFLYCAPAVSRVLGWAPAELVGRGIGDLCCERDVVAVGRALKEASLPVEGPGPGAGGTATTGAPPQPALRTVDLVFRARTKGGRWVWVECRGRLHVEPGKGRKAIVLVGRAREGARGAMGMWDAGATAGDGEVIASPGPSGFTPSPPTWGASPVSGWGESPPVNSWSPNTWSGPPSPASWADMCGAWGESRPPPAVGTTWVDNSPAPTTWATNAGWSPPTTGSLGWAMGAPPAMAVPSHPNPKRQRLELYAAANNNTNANNNATAFVSAATPTAFHGLIDPYGLLLSVGPGASAVLGHDPLVLRGQRVGALVLRDGRLSRAGAACAVERVLARWRETGVVGPGAGGGARGVVAPQEVRCALKGADGGSVDVVVRLVVPDGGDEGELPPAVAPPRLMYSVRRWGSRETPVARARAGEDVFKGLDPGRGSSWQYELQQLKFANARLVEEIEELEKGEREREQERVERERYVPPQPYLGTGYGYEAPHVEWGYPTYQVVPMKRAWHQRDDM
ncbi:hypothetical protein C8J57DRAFT_1240621 [Mycena rebaudengoi]|nr:hypothetical protein C8J57DRAFT_1240621 [Mycena rebaudengoi]